MVAYGIETYVSEVTQLINRIHTQKKDFIGVYTWASLCHMYMGDLLCQACVSAAIWLVVEDWLKWMKKAVTKKEAWSHSGHCSVCNNSSN